MPINFNEVYDTVHEIQTKVDELLQIVRLAKTAKVTVDRVGEFDFTQTQKDALKSNYDSLKTELVDLFQNLP